MRNKFENLCELVAGLFVSEFPILKTWSLRKDVSNRKGVFLVYIKSSLPCKMLTKFKLPNNIQIIPFELNLRKDKWLFVSIYKQRLQDNKYFVSILSDLLDFYSNEYGNKVVLGDSNLEPSTLACYLSWISKILLTS